MTNSLSHGASALHPVSAADASGDRTVFEIGGADSTRFLHAQLTNDVESQASGSFSWGSWLTPKGRVITVVALIRLDSSRYLLIVPTALAQMLTKRLTMFVMRSDVDIATHEFNQTLYRGDAAQRLFDGCAFNDHGVDISDERVVIKFDNPKFGSAGWQIDLSLNADKPDTNRGGQAEPTDLTNRAQNDGWGDWCVDYGLPWVGADTTDSFIPQSLNLDAIGGLSYDKGCYPGQEIVARTHFKGRLKYRMAILEFDANAMIKAGSKFAQPAQPGRSATVLSVDTGQRRATAVVPVQWFEQLGQIELTQAPGPAAETTDNASVSVVVKSPPYTLAQN